MTRFLPTLLILACFSASSLAAELDFTGDWQTTYGPMTLSESSGTVKGSYINEGSVISLEGKIQKNGVLEFSYRDAEDSGTGWFRLNDGALSFEGRMREQGSSGAVPWIGNRQWTPGSTETFAGLWETSFGRMRLKLEGNRITGAYAYKGGTLDGYLVDGKFKFRYSDGADGEGEFSLVKGGRAFGGRWRADGDKEWRDWNGFRADPTPGVRWLVVLESRWESGLDADEYTYGEMLKSFFTRKSGVRVRQRFYTDPASLAKWIREASFLAEPVVLYFSGHGTVAGLVTDDGPAGAGAIAAALGGASSVALVHFGSCDVMNGKVPAELQRLTGGRFPVSGFAQPVDWAASAVTDFMYLDLILSRDLPPARAAAELVRLMPFAARKNGKAPYDGVSFRFVPAPGAAL